MKKKSVITVLFFLMCGLACGKNNDASQIDNDKSKLKQPTTKYIQTSERYGKYIQIPDTFFGINFCNLSLKYIIKNLEDKEASYNIYDCDGKKYPSGKKIDLMNNVCGVESSYFFGKDVYLDKIISVDYGYIPPWDGFEIFFRMKMEYYEDIEALLNKKFGKENVFYNVQNYDELAWYANPDDRVPTCISKIILSKRQRYGEPEEGVFYLAIHTRGKDPHVH